MYGLGENFFRCHALNEWKLPGKSTVNKFAAISYALCNAGASSDGNSDRESLSSSHSPSPPPRIYKPCVVCEDRSSGYHYGVSSCEGCKGFFRRSVHKKVSYVCHRAKNCLVTKQTRSRCQYCRFQKCLEVGMLRESVRNDRRKKRIKEETCAGKSLVETSEYLAEPNLLLNMARTISTSYSDIFPDNTQRTNPEETKCMGNGKVNFELWREFSERSAKCITMIVEFAKRVPGFTECSVADQITLLKSACLDIMLFRICTSYDVASDSLTFSDGWSLNQNQLRSCGFGHTTDAVFHFAGLLKPLRLDTTEIALLCAICLMSPDRHGLNEATKVEHLQDMVLESLRLYTKNARPRDKQSFAKLLMTITDLRSVSAEGAERVMTLKLEVPEDTIPPLLSEMLNRY